MVEIDWVVFGSLMFTFGAVSGAKAVGALMGELDG